MSSHQPPAHLRYLKARLKPLLRPQVWGTIIFLLVVSTFAGIYFANFEEFIAEENQGTPAQNNNNNNEVDNDRTSQSNISEEDRAIAADIDISALLENDLASNTETLDVSPDKPKENIFEQFMKQRQEREKAAKSSETQGNQQLAADDNPFTIRFPTANNAARNNTATSTNPFVYNLPNNNSNNFNSTETGTTNSNNNNALQKALDRANGYTQERNLDTNGNERNPLQAALDRQLNPNNTLRNSTSTTNQSGQTNINLIAQPNQLSPLLGTTPYYNQGVTTTIPNSPIQGSVPLNTTIPGNTIPGQVPTTGVPSNIPNTYNPPNSFTYLNQPQVPVTNTIQTLPTNNGVTNPNIPNSPVQTAPNQVQNAPAPFSVPNNIPGRNIGGGQINTFSNP